MKKLLLFSIIFLFVIISYSQNAVLKGRITDAQTKDVLIGANVIIDPKTGTSTDVNGKYSISLKPGEYEVTYKFIGYAPEVKKIKLKDGEVRVMDVSMHVEIHTINEIVVSAGKFEQRLSDVTVSLEVMKPARVESMNTTNLDEAINQIPGVEISGEQPSIRGGSGYSYGAGTRVLVLVDDLPLLSPSSADPKWNFLPVENISQIEVLKGASSSLFGSSALNGVINIRTAYPGEKPETKISTFMGTYMRPQRTALVWDRNAPQSMMGTNFLHSRKIGNLDLVVGGNLFSDDSYREKEFEKYGRLNANIRYRDKKIQGLSYGVNTNYMYQDKQEFFLWRHADSAYHQNLSAVTEIQGSRLNVDPFVTYHSVEGHRFSLRSRFYHENYINPDNQSQNSRADQIYSDFQYQKSLTDSFNLTAGMTVAYSEVNANLFGDHYGSNISFYSQVDKKIKRLSLSGGFRVEYAQVDSTQTVSQFEIEHKGKMLLEFPFFPVFRAGANYRLADFTYLRSSYGQGYRFPSVAEMYTTTSLGGLKIFPNSNLRPELGESFEIGIKQGVKISNWSGYLDVAGFYTKYKHMIEYTFGLNKPDTVPIATIDYYGFKAFNIGNAEITGVDVTFAGEGKLFGLPATILLGYTYTNPIDLNVANDSNKTTDNAILKYRFYHSAKGDFEISYKKITFGLSFVYSSFMVNIDKAFEEPIIPYSNIYILPGLKEYRETHKTGHIVFDNRIAYQLSDMIKVSLVTKNIFNVEYMARPGDIRPPRNISLQFTMKF